MHWNIKQLLTNDDGSVQSEYDITSIMNDISVIETVGDELYNECGDILLKTRSAITEWESYHNWISVYIEDILFGIYELEDTNYDYDIKRGIYSYRFKSIQKVFFENLENQIISYSSDNTEYNYAINSNYALVYLLEVKTTNSIWHTCNQKYTWSLGDIISDLSGKHNDAGFLIDVVSVPCKVIGTPNNDIPVLWRGIGTYDTIDTESAAINENFYRLTKYYFSIRNFKFTVSGITVAPTVGSVYNNSLSNYEIIGTELSGGSGYLYAARSSGTNDPASSGTLTKVSGTGDNTISYSAYSYYTQMIEEPENIVGYNLTYSTYTGSSITFQVIEYDSVGGKLIMRIIDGSGTIASSGVLTNSSGNGDAKLSYSAYTVDYEYYNTNWLDIFKIIAVVYNSYIRILPKISGGYLKIDISIQLRKLLSYSGEIYVVTFLERINQNYKYEINGVLINALNYEYQYGSKVGKLFNQDAPVGEPSYENSNFYSDLYIGITDNHLLYGYDYTNPNDVFLGAGGGTPFIQQYYSILINAGDGYSCVVLPNYNDGTEKLLKVLDQIYLAGGDILQIISISINKNFLTNIEGIKIYT